MASLTLSIADAVATIIEAQWPTLNPVVGYAPQGSAGDGDFDSLVVNVVPASYTPESAGRGSTQKDVVITVGLQKKVGTDRVAVDPLVEQCEDICEHFRGIKLGTTGAVAVRSEYDPVYVADHMRQYGLFTGVVRIYARVVG